MRQPSRRQFLKGVAAVVGGAAIAPYVVPASALGEEGRPPPSDRIAMAIIGVGPRGTGVMGHFLRMADVQWIAVCDCREERQKAGKGVVDKHYGNADCAPYTDFRELLARADLDGLLIATKCHWHALASMYAAKAGKDMYCEKPMASVIADGRAAADAVKRYGRVFQTGSHERSTGNCRYACELVRNGRLGKIHTIRTFLPTGDGRSGCTGPQPVPEGFDYDMWLGPRPWEPYYSRRCHGTFRWVLDYSDGELTDRGAHVNDIALLGAGPLLVGPVEIVAEGKFMQDPLYNVPYAYNIEYTYANGMKIITVSSGTRGIRWEGTDGWLFCEIHGGALSASDPAILKTVIGPGDISLGRSLGHAQDWVSAIKSRGPTMAPAEDGHRTASFCHLAVIALQLGRKIKWDLVKERFVDDPEADRMIARPMRPPWHL
jgi:predicted dehydrogenase